MRGFRINSALDLEISAAKVQVQFLFIHEKARQV
jgi:hypothetical protein